VKENKIKEQVKILRRIRTKQNKETE
jgi:hypothetical protein